jgi:nucleoid DNA-binding protein
VFIVTPKTVNAPAALKMKQVPRKFVPHFKAGKELRERVDSNE